MKIVIQICFCLLMHTALGQAQKSYIKPGLISTSLTLSPAKMLNRNETNYYVSAYLIGRLDKNLSIRSETHVMLPNAETKFLKNNLRYMFGMEYGIPVGNLDFHVGFMPGLAVMQSNLSRSNEFEVSPLISFSAGMKFYVWKFFNFFVHANYVRSELNNLVGVSGRADEIVFTGGLGYNIQLLKKYR